jgi:hypothetical protein
LTYIWTVSDTGNGDGVVAPGEFALLTLWAHMDPRATGFAGSIYDIAGDASWQQGTVEGYHHRLSDFGDVWIEPDNSIRLIESFQLPLAFNPNFDASNPIELFSLWWSPAAYEPDVIEVGDLNHLNHDVYTDDFGTSVAYQGVPGVAHFRVVPAPATATVPAAAAWAAAFVRRRR